MLKGTICSRFLYRRVQKISLSIYQFRNSSNDRNHNAKFTVEDPDDYMESEKPMSIEHSQLLFAHRSRGETFGQLVNEAINDRNPLHSFRVVSPEESVLGVDPRYRDTQTGELLEAATSKEARLHKETRWAKVNHRRIYIPEGISDAIQNNMLFQYDPKILKQRVADWYVTLNERGIKQKTESEEEADLLIAGGFAQDYAISYQVINEFVTTLGKKTFEKEIGSVLECGFGPGTGMLALNEIMGDEWNPKVKDVLVNGQYHMARRAKILLSRQLNEYLPRSDDVEDHNLENESGVTKDTLKDVSKQDRMEVETGEVFLTEEDELFENQEPEEDEKYIGKVKTKNIKIKSIIINSLRPEERKYDLIIVQQQLLTDVDNFPHEVDAKLEQYIKRLNPNGRLIIIERGSPLGAETIGRARQFVLRPENYEKEMGKIPRPFKSSIKQMYNEIPVELSAEEKAAAMKDIEPELIEAYDIVEENEINQEEKEPIHLSVLSPCSHHGKCPLQYFDPQVYLYGQIGKKLKFCNFSVDVHRPNYLLELKRGRKLATQWSDSNSGVGIKGLSKGGRGREGSSDYETASFSYLIVERSNKPTEEIEQLRKDAELLPEREIGYQSTVRGEYPRILAPPLKKKGFVIMDVCAPSGHVEKWHISKSVGKQEYHDARKSEMGDSWPLGKKSAIQSKKENTFYFAKVEEKRENLRNNKKKDARRLKRQMAADYKAAMETDPKDFESELSKMARIDAYEFLTKPKEEERLKDKRKYKY